MILYGLLITTTVALLPPELSDQDVSGYLQITLSALDLDGPKPDVYLSPGECRKVYDNHDCLWQPDGTMFLKCNI
eukprot:SAG22_NODE_93_length_20834_cov_27.179503_13_plen_75_part_00